MKKHLIRIFTLTIILNLSACGYLLYPERVGQRSGQLDPTVIILDAGGLLIGILPGVVAFAVDLATGTIFLPPGEKSAIEKHSKTFSTIEDLKLSPIDSKEIKIERTETAKELSVLLGHPVAASEISYFTPLESKPLLLAMPTAKPH